MALTTYRPADVLPVRRSQDLAEPEPFTTMAASTACHPGQAIARSRRAGTQQSAAAGADIVALGSRVSLRSPGMTTGAEARKR